MLNFPVPYPEELLYSVIARAGVRLGVISPKQLLDEVFGNRNIIATVDLPSHVSHISNWLPDAFSTERLIYNHTLFPIYAPFVPEKNRQRCLEWMHGASQGSVHLALGVAASIVKTPGVVRYCPVCQKEQLKKNGEYYWLREWQVAGVESCPEHGTLINTRIFRPPVKRHQYIAASPDYCPDILQSNCDSFSAYISNQVRQLFDISSHHSPAFSQWSLYYQNLAHNLGFRRGRSQIDHYPIRKKVIQFWTPEWLKKNNLMVNKTGENEHDWLSSIFRKHRKCFSYLQHIVVNQALLGNDWQIRDILDEVSQYPNDCIAPTVHKSVVLNDSQTPDQESWLKLLKSYSPKQARKTSQALYARLYRKHRDWLIAVNEKFTADRSRRDNNRVDWTERDREYLGVLREVNKLLLANKAGPRRSKGYLINMLEHSSTIEKNLHRMPLTSGFLNTYSESVSEYQTRRLLNAYNDLKDQFEQPPRWRLLREAGLSDDRLTTISRKFLNRLLAESDEIQRYS